MSCRQWGEGRAGFRVQDEFVMIESQLDDGRTQQIIYRNGGDVTAESVEDLCAKVNTCTV